MQITDRDFQRSAVVFAAGYPVEIHKLPCSPRCAATYPDSPAVRRLIQQYEAKQPLDVPVKTILHCYGLLIAKAKDLRAGRIGGAL